QLGWSSAAPQALAQARFNNRPLKSLPVKALVDIASPFQVDEELEKTILPMTELLRRLGIFTIGDFMKLPLAGLSSRFGKSAMQMRITLDTGNEISTSSSQTRATDPWPSLVLPEKISEEVDLESEGLF